jgi:transcriptional regulator with XRE-family HTH domain
MANRKPVTDEAIGALIRKRRHEVGMGQPELGEALGVTSMMIQKYETGASSINVLKLVKIAETLKCKTTDLLP